MTNGHENAYPLEYIDDRDVRRIDTGLTKRELFAAMAMQGLRACGHDHAPRLPSNIAELAVADADALIAELSK